MSNHVNEIKRGGFTRYANRPSGTYGNPYGNPAGRPGPPPVPMTTQMPTSFPPVPPPPPAVFARPPNASAAMAPPLDLTENVNIRGGSGPPSPIPQLRPPKVSKKRTLAWLAGSKSFKPANTRYRRFDLYGPPGPGPNLDSRGRNANALLLRGYGVAEDNGRVPLQPRRTLDQYFYSHLENTAHRDKDQVVYRYTKSEEAKIFMVDQMWLWIINGGLSNPDRRHLATPTDIASQIL